MIIFRLCFYYTVDQTPSPDRLPDKDSEPMDIASSESDVKIKGASSFTQLVNNAITYVTSRPNSTYCSDGFSCVISMHDGVVMYTTSSLTTTLGFPKDMWIGRSFIDFVHPRDRSTFASQITNGLAAPKNVNGTQETVQTPGNAVSTMVCRIRRYRGLTSGFGVKERVVTFMPFLLKLTFKNVSCEDGEVIYLVIQATQFFSAFIISNEILAKSTPFVMRHAANGNLEYIDPESVPYLGYLPQDVIGTDALLLYHPEDLCYLKTVYETIVKEGGLPRSRPYRMLAQNGDYLILETEWSSFINPWSRKLEFVIGKHHIVKGPNNPDVFQTLELEKPLKIADDDKKQHQSLREEILKIMNEVLTKPAEVAKQVMSKRCQDLATFMESLMEDTPKDAEIRVDVQEPDQSYYERDSMLGGISPHHEYNDSKSSTETPLSYNQLNYNDMLQRYFASHQPFSYDDYNTVTGENVLGLKSSVTVQPSSNCLSPMMAHNSGDSADVQSSSESGLAGSPAGPVEDYLQMRLTESLLIKHNAEMEKELLRFHREIRNSARRNRKKPKNRLKKKAHLVRCKAPYQLNGTGAMAAAESVERKGIKRSAMQDSDAMGNKYQCSAPKQPRRQTAAPSNIPLLPMSTDNEYESSHWLNSVNNMNTFTPGLGMQSMSILPPPVAPIQAVTSMTGMFPMYYTHATTTIPSVAENTPEAPKQNPQYPSGVQCLMYDQGVYGPPYVYSPMGSHTPLSYPVPQNLISHSITDPYRALHPLGLAHRNYEEACKPSLPFRSSRPSTGWHSRKWLLTEETAAEQSGDSSSSTNANQEHNATNTGSKVVKCCEGVPVTSTTTVAPQSSSNGTQDRKRSEDTVDRTDGESSYSSFYSSFFKTESGSAEGSLDMKKKQEQQTWNKEEEVAKTALAASDIYIPVKQTLQRRKNQPPWMEKVCANSDLMYKYQILTKNMQEVLLSDKEKMSKFVQPSLVNEQLDQLYLDLQLEGVASRLTLEEGITSSSSSDDTTN
ncbi:hypothetical protein ACJJTC_012888, partial [Scirpophaga incertulas]